MDTETRYNLALDYLYSFVDYSLKHASELAKADFNLDRMHELIKKLGNPQNAYPTIHVAGTKGKGSTSALIASALEASGLKVGLYTSPHLQDYCERIQINKTPCTREQLADLVDEIKHAVSEVPYLTTFEITTAIAFMHFAQQKVDAAVIEVGLGGRLDATNIITPQVSVITSLSYDHTAVLGSTLTLIAGEKAGIIKPGIPVASSPQKDEALIVLERIAKERGAELTLIGRDVIAKPISHSLDGQQFTIDDLQFTIPLLGIHQLDNAATAYGAIKVSGFNIREDAIRKGFEDVRWTCRFEVISREPTLILDSAHNEDSFEKLNQTLEDYFPGRNVTLIMGVSEDKHLTEMLTAIKPKLAQVVITRADHPRALAPEQIAETAQQMEIAHEIVTPVSAALDRSLALIRADGSIILSAGSMFVTAEVKTAWQKK
jgi:dihydrofolate synthase/folylpolyglutamate synthase